MKVKLVYGMSLRSLLLLLFLIQEIIVFGQNASGDLQNYMDNIIDNVPGSSGGEYVIPNVNQITSWNQTIEYLLDNNLSEGRSKATEINYQITEFTDTSIDPNQIFYILEEKASVLQPAEAGLVALDWWNGNRSILSDGDLTGLILGYSLATKPEEIYRALLEALTFGTRKIFETFLASGVPINEIIVTGGEPLKNKLLLNILANVTRMEIKVADCPYPSALGSAIYAAVAAGENRGGYATISEASKNMAHLSEVSFFPNNNDKKTYNRLYSEYTMLHDYFGYGHNNAMKRLKNLRTTIFEKRLRQISLDLKNNTV